MDNKLKAVVPPYNHVFIETLLRYYPRGTEEERALAAAEMYGKRAEMEVVLQQRKKERGLFGVFRSSGKSLIEVLEEVCRPESTLEQELTLDEKELTLDGKPAKNGSRKKPNDWIKYFNKIKDNRIMASMGDLYANFKIIQKMREQGTAQEQAKAQLYLNSLREDFIWQDNKGGLATSKGGLAANTRIFYSPNSLDARVVQHYECRRLEWTKERVIEVPVYRREPLAEIASRGVGLAFLQVLLDTKDSAETIIQVLEFISGKRNNALVGWTPPIGSDAEYYTRAEKPERVVWLGCYSYDFYLNSSTTLGNSNAVRGVCL